MKQKPQCCSAGHQVSNWEYTEYSTGYFWNCVYPTCAVTLKRALLSASLMRLLKIISKIKEEIALTTHGKRNFLLVHTVEQIINCSQVIPGLGRQERQWSSESPQISLPPPPKSRGLAVTPPAHPLDTPQATGNARIRNT